MMRVLITSLLLCSSLVAAQVLEVNIWQPMPGLAEKTVQYGKEAEGIVNELGGNAMVAQDRNGNLHFVTSHKNWAEWAAFQNKRTGSKAWTSFLSKISDKPSATLLKNYLLNTPAPGKDGAVYQVYIWQPELGRGADLFQAGMKAKAIHEKEGVAVTIHADQMQNMHYVMSYESWEDWAKFQDSPHPEFQAFMQELSKNPSGRMIEVYTASVR